MSGGRGLTWAQVQPTLARSTRVCTYDRAGLGWMSKVRGLVAPR